jgi:hypothetical protein
LTGLYRERRSQDFDPGSDTGKFEKTDTYGYDESVQRPRICHESAVLNERRNASTRLQVNPDVTGGPGTAITGHSHVVIDPLEESQTSLTNLIFKMEASMNARLEEMEGSLNTRWSRMEQ